MHLSLWSLSDELSAKFYRARHKSHALKKLHFICYSLFVCNYLMYWYWKGYVLFCIFSWTPELPSKLPWQLNSDEIFSLKKFLLRFYTLSSTYYLLHLSICLCNVSDLESYNIFHKHRQVPFLNLWQFVLLECDSFFLSVSGVFFIFSFSNTFITWSLKSTKQFSEIFHFCISHTFFSADKNE